MAKYYIFDKKQLESAENESFLVKYIIKHDWKSYSLKAAKNCGRIWRNLKEPEGTYWDPYQNPYQDPLGSIRIH